MQVYKVIIRDPGNWQVLYFEVEKEARKAFDNAKDATLFRLGWTYVKTKHGPSV